MLDILNKVAKNRLESSKPEYTIQLSSVLMQKAVDEYNKTASADKQVKDSRYMAEFKKEFYGKEFTISNRSYRDDTNDADVEEILYELATQK